MKHLLTFIILLLCSVISGCTYNLTKEDYENENEFLAKINDVTENKTVRLQTRDSTFEAEEVKIYSDSLKGIVKRDNYIGLYNISTTEEPFSFPNSALKNIAVTKRMGGFGAGLGLGALIGGVLGWYLVDVSGSSNTGYHPEPGLGAEVSIFPGLVIGSILGSIVGDDYVFSFNGKLSRSELFRNNSIHSYGVRLGYNNGFKTRIVKKEGYYSGNTAMESSEVPGFAATIYYNYPLGLNFSLVNELSFISAGSEEKNSVELPVKLGEMPSYIRSSSVEKLQIIELAPLIRLNLAKEKFTPYFIIGPRLDLLFPGDSQKEKFFSDVNSQYASAQFSISGKYKKTVMGIILGGGLSTGKLFSYELLVELKYSFDITDRFRIISHFPYEYFDYYPKDGEIDHRSSSWTINLGFALD